MAKRKRGRHTGRFEPGEHFAMVPTEFLQSETYAALPDYAARVLLTLAAQYRGANNGNLSLPVKTAQKFGLPSWKRQAGLRLLLEVGAIELTRPGKYSHGRGVCALYALAWRTINITPDAFPPIDHERPAPNTWAKWQRPEGWQQFEAEIRRQAKGGGKTWDQSTRGDLAKSTRRDLGNDETPPTKSTRRDLDPPVSKSTRGGHLLDSGRGSTSSARPSDSAPGSPGSSVASKIAKLVHAQPHLTNADIARILAQYQVDAVQVAAIRGAL